MPPGRPPRAVNLTGSQAQYVLNYLIAQRKVNSGDIAEGRSALDREVRDLTDRLASLSEASGGTPSPQPARRGRPPASASATPATDGDAPSSGAGRGRKARKRRKAKLSAEGRASLQLQGRYLAALRKTPERKRAQYKRLAAAKGREAAVRAMLRDSR